MKEKAEETFLQSDQVILNQLGLMIENFAEQEYFAVINFTGHKLNRGFRIKSLVVKKQEPEKQGG